MHALVIRMLSILLIQHPNVSYEWLYEQHLWDYDAKRFYPVVLNTPELRLWKAGEPAIAISPFTVDNPHTMWKYLSMAFRSAKNE